MPLFDAIARGFTAALGMGFQVLHGYSLPLLGILAAIHFYQVASAAVMYGHGSMGDALAGSLLLLLRVGIFYWGLTHLWTMAEAALHTFIGWGAQAGGGAFTLTDFLSPSSIWDMGWRISKPIDDLIARHSGWQVLFNAPDLLMYALARLCIVVAFWGAALAVLMTIIEFNIAVVAGAVLIPWGILSATSSLCEFALSWLLGSCVRSLLTALIMAIGSPMLQQLPITSVGGDPTIYGACTVAGASVVLAILIWAVPKRAALVAGRGMALGLGGDVLTTGAVTGWRAASQGMGMVSQGASRLVQAMR
jgi:type IV secretion system protein TrbL